MLEFECARNVIIFAVNNSSLPHVDNLKNNFLVLGEAFVDQKKSLVLI